MGAERDTTAAKAFFAKAVKSQGLPQTVTLDGYTAASHRAVRGLKAKGRSRKDTHVRSSKYLDNLVEQDHRAIKQRIASMLGFKQFKSTAHHDRQALS